MDSRRGDSSKISHRIFSCERNRWYTQQNAYAINSKMQRLGIKVCVVGHKQRRTFLMDSWGLMQVEAIAWH